MKIILSKIIKNKVSTNNRLYIPINSLYTIIYLLKDKQIAVKKIVTYINRKL